MLHNFQLFKAKSFPHSYSLKCIKILLDFWCSMCYTIGVKGQEIKVPKGSLGFGYSVTKKLFEKISKTP